MELMCNIGKHRIQVWGAGSYQHRRVLRDKGFAWDRQSKVWHAVLTPARKYFVRWMLRATPTEVAKELPSHPTEFKASPLPGSDEPVVFATAWHDDTRVWLLSADAHRRMRARVTHGVQHAALYESLSESAVVWVPTSELSKVYVLSRLYSRAELLAMNEGVSNGN